MYIAEDSGVENLDLDVFSYKIYCNIMARVYLDKNSMTFNSACLQSKKL